MTLLDSFNTRRHATHSFDLLLAESRSSLDGEFFSPHSSGIDRLIDLARSGQFLMATGGKDRGAAGVGGGQRQRVAMPARG